MLCQDSATTRNYINYPSRNDYSGSIAASHHLTQLYFGRKPCLVNSCAADASST